MMMKLASLTALALMALALPSTGHAESPVTVVQEMTVQIWPDYDRPAVLVMLTGTLASSVPLPAFVNLPLLPGAQLNAVARADASGKLFDDIVYTADAGRLSLSTPNPKFRVEYYVPYRLEGGERRFTFEWLADMSVDALSVIVQKPASANSLITQPPAANVTRGEDGLSYHVLPTQGAPAREPLSVQLSYSAANAALSAERRPAPTPAAAPAPPPVPKVQLPTAPAAAADTGSGWGLLFAIVATVGASMGITWWIARNRFASKIDGETPRAEPPSVPVCPDCGLPTKSNDRFCSSCGQHLDVRRERG